MTRSTYAAFSMGLLTLGLLATTATAHEVWIETPPASAPGDAHAVHVYWGHEGVGQGGAALAGQADKLVVTAVDPNNSPTTLDVALKDNGFVADWSPAAPGQYAIGALLETGIIDKPLHDIPANTRIVMGGKSVVTVGDATNDAPPLGHDLELALVSEPRSLRVGGLAIAKVVFHGKPLGGRLAVVDLSTAGPLPASEDPRVQTSQWTIEANADPKSGEVAFPLIVAGRHTLRMHYVDETPGVYNGERNDTSSFSHLQKGDAYERTMYVVTLTFEVQDK